MSSGEQPHLPRVRVTSPRTASATRRTPRPVTTEIDAQTELGEVYIRSLLRTQLRLAAGVLTLVAIGIGGLPLLFRFAPRLADVPLLGMPLAWGMLGFVVYPVLVVLGWLFVRGAEANERTFAAMVGEPDTASGERGTTDRPSRRP